MLEFPGECFQISSGQVGVRFVALECLASSSFSSRILRMPLPIADQVFSLFHNDIGIHHDQCACKNPTQNAHF